MLGILFQLALYFVWLEDEGYTLRGSDDTSYLFEGNGLSVVYLIDSNFVYMDVQKM